MWCRAESAIIAALLHDVLDDTSVKVQQIEDQFGTEVASMVSKVSQLSSMNQLLRRRRRQLVSPFVLETIFLHGSIGEPCMDQSVSPFVLDTFFLHGS